jgi:hypothetical protein
LRVLGRVRLRGDLVYLEVAVRDPSGRTVASGRRRLENQRRSATYYVPVDGEGIAPGTPLAVEVGLRSDAADRVSLGATAAGEVGLGTIRPAADGLRLAYADQGGVVYRRLNALPRIRWASRSRVEGVRETFLALQAGVPADTVMLAGPGPRPSGLPADVTVVRDSSDRLRARVEAEGAGYLVVADAIQSGWRARLDGRDVPLRKADHALVAVHVPAGTHTVELFARPNGWRAGIAVTLAAVTVFVVLLAWALFRRWRVGRLTPPSSAPGALTPPAPERPDANRVPTGT